MAISRAPRRGFSTYPGASVARRPALRGYPAPLPRWQPTSPTTTNSATTWPHSWRTPRTPLSRRGSERSARRWARACTCRRRPSSTRWNVRSPISTPCSPTWRARGNRRPLTRGTRLGAQPSGGARLAADGGVGKSQTVPSACSGRLYRRQEVDHATPIFLTQQLSCCDRMPVRERLLLVNVATRLSLKNQLREFPPPEITPPPVDE